MAEVQYATNGKGNLGVTLGAIGTGLGALAGAGGLGALLGVPLGILLNNYVMSAIQVDLVHFEARVKFPSFLWAVGFTLLFSVLVYLIMMRKLSKIDMAAALKAAE